MSGDRVSMAVPSLINGISQQAPEFRLSSQCELQVNTLSAVLDGISKRPPTEHIARIHDGSLNQAFIHTINRDANERYVVVVYEGNLRVFDLLNNGAEVPVAFPDGKGYLATYIPQQTMRMTTVADYTFVVNKSVMVKMDETETPEEERNEAIVYIKKGIVDTTYKVMVNGFWASFTTPTPSSTVTSATSGENEGITINPETWTWTQCYNWLRDNNHAVPSAYDPYQWSQEQCGFFMYRTNGFSTKPFMVINNCLDIPVEELNARRVGASSKDKAWIDDSLAIKSNMKILVVQKSQEMAAKGIMTSVSTTTTSGSQPSTDTIATMLAGSLQVGLTGFQIDVIGSALRIRRTDNQDFQFAVTDSWGNEASMGIKREVQKYQDLPARAWDGFRVRVVGEDPSKNDDFYLEYSSDSFYKNGVWKETRGWDQLNRFNTATMPHILVREADGTFTFKRAKWAERKAGDDYSNPWPSFVDARIEDIFFYRSRLGVIVDENVILSEAGDTGVFNFWPDTATSVHATHPIDIAITNDKVSLLRHASVFGESLILFADQAQFQLGSGGQPNLAPDTVTVTKTTEYECSRLCKPTHSGQSLYFVTEQGDFSGIREYTVAPDSVAAVAPEITSHVPKYLPKGLFKMATAINDGTLFAISNSAPNAVYVYRYFWVGEEKIQSSWSHWLLSEEAKILSMAAIESSVYLVVQYPDGVCLERLNLNSRGEEAEMGHRVFLDRKVRLRGVYDANTDTTAWTLPYEATAMQLTVLTTTGFPGIPLGVHLPVVEVSGTVAKVFGDYSQSDVIAGVNYEMRYRFSPQYVRESKEPGAAVIKSGRLQILNFTLSFKDSGPFHTEVRSRGRDVKIKRHVGILGSLGLIYDKPVIESGLFWFAVLSKNDQVAIDIVNSTPYPSCFQAAEWEGTYSTDARRM